MACSTSWASGCAPASDVYSAYERVCQAHGVTQLSHRRFTDLLLELELYGFIRAQKVSLGRYGRQKEITLLVSADVVERILSIIRINLTETRIAP